MLLLHVRICGFCCAITRLAAAALRFRIFAWEEICFDSRILTGVIGRQVVILRHVLICIHSPLVEMTATGLVSIFEAARKCSSWLHQVLSLHLVIL